MKPSRPTTSAPCASSRSESVEPMKPAAPVTSARIHYFRVGPHPHALTRSHGSARAYLEQDVGAQHPLRRLTRSHGCARAYLEPDVGVQHPLRRLTRSHGCARAYLQQDVGV